MSAEFSPDATRALILSTSNSEDKEQKYQLTLWDTATGKELYSAITGTVLSLSPAMFDRVHETIALPGPNNATTIRRLSDIEAILGIPGKSTPLQAIVFSPNGLYLAIADAQGEIHIANTADGTTVKSIPQVDYLPKTMQFTADSNFLIVSGRITSNNGTHETRVFSVAEGNNEPISHWPEQFFVLSPEANLCAAFNSIDSSIKLRFVETGESIIKIPLPNRIRHQDESIRAGFASASELLVASNNWACSFDPLSGEKLYELAGHTNIIRDVAYSKSLSCWVTCAKDKTVRVWSSLAGRDRMRSAVPIDTRGVDTAAISDDHRTALVASCSEDYLQMFDSNGAIKQSRASGKSTSKLLFDNRAFVVANRRIRLVDVGSGRIISEVNGPQQLYRISPLTQNSCLILTLDGGCYFWNIHEPFYRNILEIGEVYTCHSVASDGTSFLLGTNTGNCRLIESLTAGVKRLIAHPSSLTDVRFLDEKRILTTDALSTIRVWDENDSEPHSLFQGVENKFDECRVDEGRNLVFTYRSSGNSPIECWNPETWERLGIADSASYTKVLLDPSGQQLIQGSQEGLRVWQYPSGENVELSTNNVLDIAILDRSLISVEVSSKLDERWYHPQTQSRVICGYSLDTHIKLFETSQSDAEIETPIAIDQTSLTFGIPQKIFRAQLVNRETRESKSIGQHGAPISFADYYVDGAIITAGYDGIVQSLDIRGIPLHKVSLGKSVVAASRHGVLIACGLTDGSIALLDLDEFSSQHVFKRTDGNAPVVRLQFSQDGQRLIAGYEDDKLDVWNVSGRSSTRIPGPANRGTFLADTNLMLLWQVATEQSMRNGTSIAPLPVTVFESSESKTLETLPNSNGALQVLVSSSGQRIAVQIDAHSWRTYSSDRNQRHRFDEEWNMELSSDPEIEQMALSPSGKFFAVAERNSVQVFDLDLRKQVRYFEFPGARFWNSGFSWQPFSKDENWISVLQPDAINIRSMHPDKTFELYSERRLSSIEREFLEINALEEN